MTADELIDLLIAKAPPRTMRGGASEEQIVDAERALGVSFPPSYRLFLAKAGVALWPEYIYGLGESLLPGLDIVATHKAECEDVEPPMPRYLLPFSPDGWGNHFCVDTRKESGGEYPVVLWLHDLDEDQIPEITHPSFVAWLRDLLVQEDVLIA